MVSKSKNYFSPMLICWNDIKIHLGFEDSYFVPPPNIRSNLKRWNWINEGWLILYLIGHLKSICLTSLLAATTLTWRPVFRRCSSSWLRSANWKRGQDDGKLFEICVWVKSDSPRNVGGGFVTVSSCSCSSAVDVRCPGKLKFSRLYSRCSNCLTGKSSSLDHLTTHM